jgi:hypothetical protein
LFFLVFTKARSMPKPSTPRLARMQKLIEKQTSTSAAT